MDYTNDILARLQRGESVDALASELTKAINEANNRYLAEQEAKRKEAKRADKVDAIDALLLAIENVLVTWDILDDETREEFEKINPEELVDELDKTIPALQEYAKLMEAVHGMREARATEKPQRKACAGDPTGDPIEEFLNKFVR